MANKIRTCMVCGSRYEYCMKCDQYKALPAWHNLFDVDACYDVYNILDAVRAGLMSKSEAKTNLKNYKVNITNPTLKKEYNAIVGSKKEEIVNED